MSIHFSLIRLVGRRRTCPLRRCRSRPRRRRSRAISRSRAHRSGPREDLAALPQEAPSILATPASRARSRTFGPFVIEEERPSFPGLYHRASTPRLARGDHDAQGMEPKPHPLPGHLDFPVGAGREWQKEERRDQTLEARHARHAEIGRIGSRADGTEPCIGASRPQLRAFENRGHVPGARGKQVRKGTSKGRPSNTSWSRAWLSCVTGRGSPRRSRWHRRWRRSGTSGHDGCSGAAPRRPSPARGRSRRCRR